MTAFGGSMAWIRRNKRFVSIGAALIIAAQEGAAHNPALMQKLADAVRQGAKASGLDLDAIQLTDTGFVPVKG